MIKRFYNRLFIKNNPKLVRERFVNVPYQKIFMAMKNFISKYFKGEDESEMSEYFLFIFEIKYKAPQKDSQVKGEAELFKDLLGSFSKKKYDLIHESYYFRVLVNFIAEGKLPELKKTSLQHLLDTEEKYINILSDKYMEVMNDLFQK